MKDGWEWDGVVVSDYTATRSVTAMTAELDVELPSAQYLGRPLLGAVLAGQMSVTDVDDAVRRLRRAEAAAGLLDEPDVSDWDREAGLAVARDVATASTVLLVNRGLAGGGLTLPLPQRLRSVAVPGPGASAVPAVLGSGRVLSTSRRCPARR